MASQKSLERELESFSVQFRSDKAFIVDSALFFFPFKYSPLKGFTDNLLSGFGVKDEFGAARHHSAAPRCSPSYEDVVQKVFQSYAGKIIQIYTTDRSI